MAALARDLATDLADGAREAEAAAVLLQYLGAVDEAVALLAAAAEWREALRVALSRGRFVAPNRERRLPFGQRRRDADIGHRQWLRHSVSFRILVVIRCLSFPVFSPDIPASFHRFPPLQARPGRHGRRSLCRGRRLRGARGCA